jgi:uncharacterized membrane protein YhhN
MQYHLIPVPFAIAGIAVYMRARMKNDLKTVAVIQPLNTIIAMAIAGLGMLSPSAEIGFTLWVLAGLGIALAGDFLNVDMTRQQTVMVGLIIFVFAYLTYAAGLAIYNGFHREDLTGTVVILAAYGILMGAIWRGLGDMKLPVLVYGLVHCFMVTRALSTFNGTVFSATQAWLLSAGTLMLFIGDMEFAVHTFRKPLKFSLGPILYAGGQLLISLSPAYF